MVPAHISLVHNISSPTIIIVVVVNEDGKPATKIVDFDFILFPLIYISPLPFQHFPMFSINTSPFSPLANNDDFLRIRLKTKVISVYSAPCSAINIVWNVMLYFALYAAKISHLLSCNTLINRR